MSSRQRKILLLSILGVLLAVVVYRQLPAPAAAPAPVQPRDLEDRLAAEEDGWVPAATRPASRQRRGESEEVTTVSDLAVELLEARTGEYSPGRNPFAFYVAPRPQPVRTGPTPEELEAQRRAREAELAAKRAAEQVPEGPSPPEITYAYLGSFGPQSRPIAVFTDGETIVNALVGDLLDGKFRVVDIGYESVALAYVDFPDLPAERIPVGLEGL